MEYIKPIEGHALNAVDAKGRVSLPATFRTAIERRTEQAKQAGLPAEDNLVYLAEDEDLPCLVGHDEIEHFQLARQQQEERRNAPGGSRKGLARRQTGGATFGPLQRVPFDGAGRMVLNGMLRKITGISSFAFFIGNGENFDIWEPTRARDYFEKADQRMLAILAHLCEEKGVSL